MVETALITMAETLPMTQLPTLTVKQHTAAQTAEVAPLSPLGPQVTRQCTIPASKWRSSFQAEEKAMRTALKLAQEDVSLHKVRIISDSVSTLQCIQNLHTSQQAANSDENEILDALAMPSDRGCHFTFTWCPSHSGICGNEIADMVAKEGKHC